MTNRRNLNPEKTIQENEVKDLANITMTPNLKGGAY